MTDLVTESLKLLSKRFCSDLTQFGREWEQAVYGDVAKWPH